MIDFDKRDCQIREQRPLTLPLPFPPFAKKMHNVSQSRHDAKPRSKEKRQWRWYSLCATARRLVLWTGGRGGGCMSVRMPHVRGGSSGILCLCVRVGPDSRRCLGGEHTLHVRCGACSSWKTVPSCADLIALLWLGWCLFRCCCCRCCHCMYVIGYRTSSGKWPWWHTLASAHAPPCSLTHSLRRTNSMPCACSWTPPCSFFSFETKK